MIDMLLGAVANTTGGFGGPIGVWNAIVHDFSNITDPVAFATFIQVLMIEKGRGRYQLQGKPVQEMLPNQPVFFPPGVPHWHGAAPDEGLTWISTSIGGVKWMQEVTDKEYKAGP